MSDVLSVAGETASRGSLGAVVPNAPLSSAFALRSRSRWSRPLRPSLAPVGRSAPTIRRRSGEAPYGAAGTSPWGVATTGSVVVAPCSLFALLADRTPDRRSRWSLRGSRWSPATRACESRRGRARARVKPQLRVPDSPVISRGATPRILRGCLMFDGAARVAGHAGGRIAATIATYSGFTEPPFMSLPTRAGETPAR